MVSDIIKGLAIGVVLVWLMGVVGKGIDSWRAQRAKKNWTPEDEQMLNDLMTEHKLLNEHYQKYGYPKEHH